MKLKSDLIDMLVSKESGRVVHIGAERADFNHLGAFPAPYVGAGLIDPSAPIMRQGSFKVLPGWALSLTNEWLWAAVICAVPFALFGALEVVAAGRRKRAAGIARRSKSRAEGSRS